MITDLTVGHPKHTLWRFLLPMFISVMFQQLYNIADSSIAGRFAGEDALAAVGASYPITVIFMAFAVGSNLGASVVVSRLFGARDIGKMKSAVYTAFIACGLMSLILTVLGYVYCGSMMRYIPRPIYSAMGSCTLRFMCSALPFCSCTMYVPESSRPWGTPGRPSIS